MSGVTGDIHKLELLVRGLENVTKAGFRRALAASLALEAKELILEGFDKQADPYGSAWAPLKHNRARNVRAAKASGKSATGRVLQSTGRLKSSITVGQVSSAGFTMGSNAVYAAVHNFGHAFAPRKQAAVFIKGGQLMFIRDDERWLWEMGARKRSKMLKKIGAPRGASGGKVSDVARVIFVTVAPVVPRRQFIPADGVPAGWITRFQEALDEHFAAVVKV